ncbi:glycosyltransferase family 4 protein, partial [Vibrio parahaemolyticus]
IYGEGNLQAALEEKLKESNLSDLVRLNGWETDKDIIFTSFDILLAPSNFEAFGLIFVEAASYGVPSIASSVEGIPEV